MTVHDAAHCTPIAVRFLPEPLFTWADLRDVRFVEPFFRDTLARLPNDKLKALTGVDVLRALDERPTLEPSLFIFQVSRCGSTLLAQMLAALPDYVVLSEVNVVNNIVAARLDQHDKVELFRLVVRALGRNRAGARHLVLKLTSWNVLAVNLIQRAFPATPMIWLQRDPLRVLASHAAQPAAWLSWRETGDPALALFGLTVDEARAMSAARFRLHAIEALFSAAHAAKLSLRTVDYARLPDAVWDEVAPHAQLTFAPSAIERMRERARFDSKAQSEQPFRARAHAPLSEAERQLVAERIAPLYRTMRGDEAEPRELAERALDR